MMVGASISGKSKVLVVISHFALGGAENVALRLARETVAKVDYTFFAVLGEGTDTEVGRTFESELHALGIATHRGTHRAFKRGGVLEAANKLRRLIKAVGPDVIHVHTEIPELTAALALIGLTKKVKAKVLRTVHNTQLWGGGWGLIGRWVTRALAPGSVVAVSRAALEADGELAHAAGAKYGSRGTLIYNGVAAPARRHTALAHDPVHIVFAGRFTEQKGVDLLPQILLEASRASDTCAQVTLIGEGPLRDTVEAGIAKLALPWPVRFLAAVPNLAEQLADYDALVMPSRFEGLGLIAIEARLAGLPVIGFAAPGLSEVIGEAGGLVAPLLDVPALARALTAFTIDPQPFFAYAASKTSEFEGKFSLAAMCKSYLEQYEAIANKT